METINEYLATVKESHKEAFSKLRTVILQNLPEGFHEQILYQMIAYVVPHDIYPKGYHARSELPLPFMSLASQKNYIALYHQGIYLDKNLETWFKRKWQHHGETRLNMGKSCIRFRDVSKIPFDLIADLVRQMGVNEYIQIYESHLK